MSIKVAIEEDNLKEIEHLLCQSMNGIHLLFDNQSISSILQTPTEEIDFFHDDNMDEIQALLNTFIDQKSFQSKKRYLLSLNEKKYELLLRAYFHIVDSTVKTATIIKH